MIFYFQTCSWLHKGLARMPIICTFTDYGYGVTKHHGPKYRSFRDLFWQITNILQQPIAMPKCISRWPQRASDLNSGPILGAGPSAPAGPVLTARSVGNLYLFSCCSMLILFFIEEKTYLGPVRFFVTPRWVSRLVLIWQSDFDYLFTVKARLSHRNSHKTISEADCLEHVTVSRLLSTCKILVFVICKKYSHHSV